MKKVDYCLSFPENSRTRNLDKYSESYDSFSILSREPDVNLSFTNWLGRDSRWPNQEGSPTRFSWII